MNGVDLARFEFDYDTTWAAFLLDADLKIYSRYGGRDGSSSDGRYSKESLLQTMREVLDVHERRVKLEPAQVKQLFHPAPGPKKTPEDIPLLRRNHQGCVHCHQVQEYSLLQAYHDGKFDRDILFRFPLPENIGVTFDRAHGHRIKKVLPGSPADAAKLVPGDIVTRLDNVPVHSEEDLRWALHHTPQTATVRVTVERAPAAGVSAGPPETLVVELKLDGDWRQSDLSWRKSLRSVPLALGFLAYPMGREERRSAGLVEENMAIRVVSIRGEGLGTAVGLQKDDVITALGADVREHSFDQFKSDVLRRYAPGNNIELTVLRSGKKIPLRGKLPAWHTTDNSVP